VVLEAQLAAIDEVRAGRAFTAAHEAATRVIVAGLCALKLIPGSPRAALKSGDYLRYFPHKTGHWIGLDVHDVGDYRVDDEPRMLEPGMVVTVEPGIYIAPDDTTVPAKWRGLGIRIEDDVAVTARGQEVLTAALPKDVAAVEALPG
jgi:Xaa-Pro aminopeptidase